MIHKCVQQRGRVNELHMYHCGTSVLHKFQLRRISLKLVQQLERFVFNYGYFLLIHNEKCHKYLTLLSLSFPLLLNSYEASWSPFSHCLWFLISVYSFHWLQCVHLGKELHTGEEKKKKRGFCGLQNKLISQNLKYRYNLCKSIVNAKFWCWNMSTFLPITVAFIFYSKR